MRGLTLRSPAKLNLYLKVINKRQDGYHNIVTLFERISLFDDMRLTLKGDGKISIQCDHPFVPTGSKNLVHKAAKLLQQDYGIKKGVHFLIHKRIPVAAGLGGGSSNAATALLGLNRLWNLKLSRQKLNFYAHSLGSDVAFFLNDSSWALGTERGDKIRPLNIKKTLWHVVVVPKIKMYAWKVYEGLKLKLTKKVDDVNILLHYLRKNKNLAASELFCNDLETRCMRLYPRLMQLKQRLVRLNAKGVMVSGSGPAVFGIVETEQQAQRMASALRRRFNQVFVVRTF